MKNSRIGKTALIAAAVTLTASLSVGSALAYFTTYCTAEGAYTMKMGFPDTDLEEHVDEEGKHIWVENTGEYEAFVRVKVFAPENLNVSFNPSNGWEYHMDDDYWYYSPVLQADGKTTELLVSYTFPVDEAPNDEIDTRPDEFNIVVIYESVPVLYNENGDADMMLSWSNVAAIESSGTATDDETENPDDTDTAEQEGE